MDDTELRELEVELSRTNDLIKQLTDFIYDYIDMGINNYRTEAIECFLGYLELRALKLNRQCQDLRKF